MASGTIQTTPAPNNQTTLFSNSSGANAINSTITLSDDMENYKLLVLTLYNNATISAGYRGTLAIPVAALSSPTYWPLACGGTLGNTRTNLSSGTSLVFLASSYSALRVQEVLGIK